MKILFICDEYPPGQNGGIGSVTRSLAREMVLQGHQVFVVGLYTYEYGEADYEEDEGVKVWRLRYGLKLPNIKKLYVLQRRMPDAIKRLLFAKRDFKKFTEFVQQLIKEHKIEIVEQPDWNTYAYNIGLLNPVLPRLTVPLVLKSHGSHTYFCEELKKTPKPLWQQIDSKMFARADALAAVSNYTAFQNKQIFKLGAEIEVLYNGIELFTSTNSIERDPNLVFFSGTLVHKKGIFSLLEAWNLVYVKQVKAKLVVFGKGNQEDLKKILNPNAYTSVTFMGHQPRNLLVTCLRKASIAVFPSFSETFGLAPVEAMVSGCPTIFTKRSCGPEIITDGITGLLVEPTDIQEIAEKIILLLNDEQLRNKLGVAGQREVKLRFEIGNSVKNHIAFYRKVIQQFRS